VHIRPACGEDVEAASRVHLASWRTTYAGIVADEFLDQLERDLDAAIDRRRRRWDRTDVRKLVAVTPGDHVVGFADGGPVRDGDAAYSGEVYAIYLLKGWQGLGVGRGLFSALGRALAEAGHASLKLWVLTDNPARRFYERLGGVLVDRNVIAVGGQALPESAYGWADTRAEPFARPPTPSA
jgi:GNAT superfamily N-acetyltransferase